MNVNLTNRQLINVKGVNASWFILLLALANTLLYHYPLTIFALSNVDYTTTNGLRTLLTLFVIVFSVTSVFYCVIALVSPYLLQLFGILTSIGNSVALFFIATYHVILDKSMMSNILNTRAVESTEFISSTVLIYILLLGVVPAWAVYRFRIAKIKRIRVLGQLVISLVLMMTVIYLNASTSLWFDKHSKQLGGMMLPWSYIVNTARLQADRLEQNKEQTLLPAVSNSKDQKTVVVLVIGETARAQNFSLYGYHNATNPRLSASNAIALPNAKACSTYTTASIHCMLSHDGSTSGAFEPLPSYLQRHDVEVVWRTKNWGEPAIQVTDYTKSSDLLGLCEGPNCEYDEVLLTGLIDRIHASKKDKTFIVLHTKGSHGPSYHTRYPENFERFTPVCKSVELDKCSESALINAYDNTILYTDYFLSETIKELNKLSDVPTLMMYVSDHGESLGEFGLYLHGTPNAIAPSVQTRIPFIIWMSDSFKQLNNISATHFDRPAYSHSNVFHSIMGAFGMTSDIYNQEDDIFSR